MPRNVPIKAALFLTAAAFLSSCECAKEWYYDWSDGEKPPASTPITSASHPDDTKQKTDIETTKERLCTRLIMELSMASAETPALRYDPEDPLILSVIQMLARAKIIGSAVQKDRSNVFILSTIKRSPGLWVVQLKQEQSGKILLQDEYAISEQE